MMDICLLYGFVYIFVSLCVCVGVYVCLYMCLCVYVGAWVCLYLCIYVYIWVGVCPKIKKDRLIEVDDLSLED